MVFILKIAKGYNFAKNIGGFMVQFIISAHHPMMCYICTKCAKNIKEDFRFIEWTQYPH